ncbi:MAG: glycosyltransferase [Bacteroidales bacterium]|jgi:glycosyltransferase involved in cell wall biosynthesis|nr:glycosyltransferase [Bacteroidales bacterium]
MMTILAYIVISFAFIQLLVSAVNLIFETYLPAEGKKDGPLVSVLIPARNEEENIGNILDDLLAQEYRNIEVIVFDDQSDDRTPEIVTLYTIREKKISLIDSAGLPEGWLGKNYACHSLAQSAKGEYFLFLDADVRISGNVIGRAVSFSDKKRLDLISSFPRQLIETPGEMITVPVMNYILVSLLPLVLVRSTRFISLSAANGQFMFFRAGAYKELMPHEKVRNNMVEDIHIARMFKKAGKNVSCLLGDNDLSCRMYRGFRDAVNGFSKNVIAFFGNSFLLAVLFFLVTTFGFLAVLASMPLSIFAAYVVACITARIIISVASRQNVFYNLLLIIPLQFSLGLFIYRASINKIFRRFQWKGRNLG